MMHYGHCLFYVLLFQDAPVNKLLFAKDRPRYRKMLQDMYTEIRCTPKQSDKSVEAYHKELSEVAITPNLFMLSFKAIFG